LMKDCWLVVVAAALKVRKKATDALYVELPAGSEEGAAPLELLPVLVCELALPPLEAAAAAVDVSMPPEELKPLGFGSAAARAAMKLLIDSEQLYSD
jgi:hypothetical protein